MEAEEAWEGRHYQKGWAGLRILIVGESHYSDCPDEETSDISKRVVRHYLRERNWPFFNTIEKILGDGEITTCRERIKLWQSVAFINFVTAVILKDASPTRVQFQNSLPRFRRVVSELKPDLVCFFSLAAWECRPWGNDPYLEAFGHIPEHHDGSYQRTFYRTDWGKPVMMARFNHPRRLNVPVDIWRAWAARVRELTLKSLQTPQL